MSIADVSTLQSENHYRLQATCKQDQNLICFVTLQYSQTVLDILQVLNFYENELSTEKYL